MGLGKSGYIPSQEMTQWYEEIKTYAASGNTEIISKLLKNVPKTGTDKKGNTLLHCVSGINSDEIVKYFIEAGFDINAKNRHDETSIIKAILKNSEKTVKTLISLGANIDHTYYKDGRGPLHFAVSEGHINLIKLLLDAGCDVNAKTKRHATPLSIAVEKNNVEMVKILLDAGASRDNTYYHDNKGPLHLACENNCLKMVELLLDSGFDLSAMDIYGYTPLFSAVLSDEEPDDGNKLTDIMKVLIQAGADVNAIDFNGSTPLHVAVDLGPEEVDLLLKAGARPDEVDNDGNTPLLLLIDYRGKHDIISVKLLIEAGADVNKVNSKGLTCIHHAARHAAVGVLTLLLEHGAIPGLLDNNNMDPLDYAVYTWSCDYRYILPYHGTETIEDQIEDKVRCTEILCKHTTKMNHVMQDRHFNYYNFNLYNQVIIIKTLHALLRQGMIVNFENKRVRNILVTSNPSLKLPLALIKHAAICNGYKNGKGLINFNLEKLNEKQKKYYADCLDELKRLNVFLVYESMTLFNLIEGRVSSRYIFNKDLIKAFRKGTIAKSFPIFKDELTESFKKEYEKYELLSKATAGLEILIGFCENSFALIYYNILKYLGTDDQRTLASIANIEISKSPNNS